MYVCTPILPNHYLFLSLSLSLSLSFSLSSSLSLKHLLSISLSVSLFLFLSLSQAPSLFLSICLSLFLPLSLLQPHYFCLCLALHSSLNLSVYLSINSILFSSICSYLPQHSVWERVVIWIIFIVDIVSNKIFFLIFFRLRWCCIDLFYVVLCIVQC